MILVFILSLFVGDLEQSDIRLTTTTGTHRYHIEIADDPFEQMKGLMGRRGLGDDKGMLFVYRADRQVQFWMKNVSFPLDMVFLDRCGIVLSIHENAVAHDETIINAPFPVRAVLELRAGATRRALIRKGHQFDLSDLKGTDVEVTRQPDRANERPLPCFY